MKTPLNYVLTVCILTMILLSGCANAAEEDAKTIYYKGVPGSLTADLASAIKDFSQEKPLTDEAKATVRTAIGATNLRYPARRKQQLKIIRETGEGSIPVMAEALTSQDETTRQKAILALSAFHRIPPKFTEDYLTKTEPLLIMLYRRSLVDKNIEVRRKALGSLTEIGIWRKKDHLPDGVLAGIEQALEDPDENMRLRAQEAKEALGLSPPTPREPSPGVF
jgi:hypothetical protein